MTHKDFLYNVQKLCQLDASHCSVMLNALCRLMSQAAVEQIPVVLPGLGKFLSHKHPEYIQEDQQTGQQTLYPPRISYRLYTEGESIVNADEEKNNANNDILENQLAEQAKMSVDEATRFINAFTSIIVQKLNGGEEVEVHGIGSFRIVESRQGELHRIAYTPDEQMRNAVNAPFACFEPVIIKAAKETASSPIIINNEPMEEMNDTMEEPIVENVTEPVTEPAKEPEFGSVAEQIVEPTVETPKEPASEPSIDEAPVLPTESEESDEQQAESDPLSEPEPEPEPEPKNPRAEAEPVSIAQHYQEFADENKKTPLIRLLSLLLILACAALAWFIYKLEHPTITHYNREVIENAVEPEQTPVDTIEEGGEEIFFGENENIVAMEAAQEETTAQAEAERAEQEAAAKAEAERLAAEKAVAEKLAAEKAAAEKLAAEKLAAEKLAAEKAAKDKAAAEKAAKEQNQTTSTSTAGRLKKADGTYATHKLEQGGRLTLVALEHYGDKVFWPYIYEVNRDKLKNPSLVQPGMVLYLPDPSYFGINVNDPNSIAKAKAKAAQYLK